MTGKKHTQQDQKEDSKTHAGDDKKVCVLKDAIQLKHSPYYVGKGKDKGYLSHQFDGFSHCIVVADIVNQKEGEKIERYEAEVHGKGGVTDGEKLAGAL